MGGAQLVWSARGGVTGGWWVGGPITMEWWCFLFSLGEYDEARVVLVGDRV